MQVSGKKALVTGGAVRIGKVICETLAAAGCEIAIQYRESGKAAAALVHKLATHGVHACALQADLGNTQETAALLPHAVAALGTIDILINNAAVFHKQDLLAATPEALQEEIGVNALAPIALMRAFGELHAHDATTGWARAGIVNILDRRVARVEKGALPYTLSKNMLRDATQIAALELGPHIRVNAVAPGPILPPPGEGAAYLAERAGPMVLAQRPTPQQVADAVLFLLQADGITGQVIYVDSGQHLL